MPRPFNSEKVIEEKINEATLRAYHVGFEFNEFRLTPLVDVLMRALTEFAFGWHEGVSIPHSLVIEKIREAAKIVYQTDKYQKRGEFGELILHFLLRDFHHTIPLVSKIYFKDSYNATVHGFDGVHVTINGSEKKLWLGESKLYKSGKDGINELAEDLKNHLKADYLRNEFELIYKKLPNQIPEIDYWRDLIDKHTTLENIFSNIVIPMVCTYSSDVFKSHCEATSEFFADFRSECDELNTHFESKKIKTSIDVILLLFPVPDKNKLNFELNNKLKAFQV